VKLIQGPENIGFAKAVNRVIESTSAPYILLLNPDTVPEKGLLSASVEYMQGNANVGIVGPEILDKDGSVQGSARAYPTPLTAFFGRSSPLSRWFPNNCVTSRNLLTGRSDGSTPMEVDWVSGACMMVRRRAIDEVGALDERFFMYWEDADWCKRMWGENWRVIYFPNASIMHYVGISSRTLIFRSILEFHKSIYRLFDKYCGRKHVWLKPLVILGLAVRICGVLATNGFMAWWGRRRLYARMKKAAPTVIRRKKAEVLKLPPYLGIEPDAPVDDSMSKVGKTEAYSRIHPAEELSPRRSKGGY
jgi:GT2 family glycosyltransferase